MTLEKITWQNLPANDLGADEKLLHAWDGLNAERGGLPFLQAYVIALALKIFGDGSERLLIGTQNGEIIAMLIMKTHGKFRWITFQPSQLPLGAWVASLPLRLGDIAKTLLHGPLGFCLTVSITQIDPHLVPRENDSPSIHTIDYIETGWVNIEGSFEDYWSARGKNLRQNMRKQRNKLAAEGVVTEMRILTEPADMAGAVERYGAMESIGWKAGEGTAVHPDNAQGRFYRELLEDAARRNEAAVYEYRFDDRTVAMNLCLLRNGTIVVLKTTYDESVPSAFSPAFLLRQEELEQMFHEGKIHQMEYFGRLKEWHTKLTDNKRMLYHLTVYRSSLIKQFANWRREKAAQKEEQAA